MFHCLVQAGAAYTALCCSLSRTAQTQNPLRELLLTVLRLLQRHDLQSF